MKVPPFTLTRRFDAFVATSSAASVSASAMPHPRVSAAAAHAAASALPAAAALDLANNEIIKRLTPGVDWASAIARLDPRLRRVIADSIQPGLAGPVKGAKKRKKTGRAKAATKQKPNAARKKRSSISQAAATAARIVRQVALRDDVLRVGILDMGAWIGGLPNLLSRLNSAQDLFAIFEVQAAVPAGLVKTPEGMVQWIEKETGERLPPKERKSMQRQLITDDFFSAAADIRESMGLDRLVGITPAMLAGRESDGPFWNYFTRVRGSEIVISTADVRDYAEVAGRPFEAAVGAMLIPTLLIAANSNLRYHDDTGCLFDFNQARVTFIESIHNMMIDVQCKKRMTPDQWAAASGMVKAISAMKRRPA